jgi:hypothetical protein
MERDETARVHGAPAWDADALAVFATADDMTSMLPAPMDIATGRIGVRPARPRPSGSRLGIERR